MRISKVIIRSFKRFNDLVIQNIPETAKLVVMTGTNGSGKSSVFDAFMTWHRNLLYPNQNYDKDYHNKTGLPEIRIQDSVRIDFYQPIPDEREKKQKIFNFRTAYRNDSDFKISSIQKIGEEHEYSRLNKLIDNDISVSFNYQRLVAETLTALYGGERDTITVQELRDELIGQIRDSMLRVFEGLNFVGINNALEDGTFVFSKGKSCNFKYKNLSGGEKAAFDILLDFVIKKDRYDNTIFCIDEPETHLNNRIQSKLLEELINILQNNSQLWIATHSIGMMRCAQNLQKANPNEVVFLDFSDKDFDEPQILEPHPVNRTFWKRTLKVTLDELSDFILPQSLVICEGNPIGRGNPKKAEFDAQCYCIIFAEEFPDTQFISAGGANDVEADKLALVGSIKALAKGVNVFRVVDRDDRNEEEILDFAQKGIRVLSRRHIESYLFDDEILILLCQNTGKLNLTREIFDAKKEAIENSIQQRNNPQDDIKSASGEIYNSIKRILHLNQCGNNTEAFCKQILAPLVTTNTQVYKDLKKDIFG